MIPSRARVVVVGSSNTDMIVRAERIPRPGETILGTEFTTAAGGKGANQAVAAARAGGDVTLVARIGNDVFGVQAVAGFVRDGIHVEQISRDPKAASGVALICVARDGENSIAVASGANALLSPEDVKRAEGVIAGASCLLLQLEVPLETVRCAAETASRFHVPVILNPAPARDLPRELLRMVSILTPNETEAGQLTGVKICDENSAARAAGELLDCGVETVILTLGPRGVYVATRSERQMVPGHRVNAVDTTAAGDVFNGALAVALGEGKPLMEAVRFANAAAAISVTRQGAQPSAPGRSEIEEFLNLKAEPGTKGI